MTVMVTLGLWMKCLQSHSTLGVNKRKKKNIDKNYIASSSSVSLWTTQMLLQTCALYNCISWTMVNILNMITQPITTVDFHTGYGTVDQCGRSPFYLGDIFITVGGSFNLTLALNEGILPISSSLVVSLSLWAFSRSCHFLWFTICSGLIPLTGLIHIKLTELFHYNKFLVFKTVLDFILTFKVILQQDQIILQDG